MFNSGLRIFPSCLIPPSFREKKQHSLFFFPMNIIWSEFNFPLKMKRVYDLEDRLVSYTARLIEVVESLPKNRTGNYLAGQMIKSCHSPALNYGEAQAAESADDFIHKLKVVLKELKECRVALKIIVKKEFIKPVSKLSAVVKETEELIAIIATSISTAQSNNKK
jgi:four helix bundle protein